MKSGSSGVPERSGAFLDQKRVKALVAAVELILLLLGAGVLLIGNGLLMAALPLLLIVFWRQSARQVFKHLSRVTAALYFAAASMLVGVGIWLLVGMGFKEQNLICVAWRLLG